MHRDSQIATLLLLQCVLWTADACPSPCKCMWRGGKQTVECIGEKLITLPDGIDQGTQVLDVSRNNLQVLATERFQRMGLTNLQKIYMSDCRISLIHDSAFRGLTNLVELDLSHNFLTTIPTATFNDYRSLMKLVLNKNPIRVLKTGSFLHLSSLTSLELSNCELEVIEVQAFNGLDSLEWLKLDGNRLQNVRGPKTLPDSLHGINLQHNPWNCDCKMMDLHSWLTTYSVPQTVDPICAAPTRLKGQAIRTLDPMDLACLPDVSPTTLYLEIAEGKNVSLLCRVSAIPEAKVSWWFEGRILQNDSIVAPGLHLYYFVEEGTEEKKSELFIYNTNPEDNGTFICMAENPAGKAHSNYTIRIIVKEEPIVEIPTFKYEYIITISAATGVAALLILIAIILCIIRCRRQRRTRRKKERSKVVALHEQQVKPAPESNPITRIAAEVVPPPAKVNGSVVMGMQREVVFVGPGVPEPTISVSAHSLRNFPLEQNPDLINDTESVGKERRLRAGEEGDITAHGSYKEAMENIVALHPMATLPRGGYQHHHTADVHLSPGRFLDSDGYPVDYGLPKIPVHPDATFYRTLPRPARLAREAEFLPPPATAQPVPYENYSPSDVRYTVEGYPCAGALYSVEPLGSFPDSSYLPSPPAPYKGDPVPATTASPWPSLVPQCCVASQTNGDAKDSEPEEAPPLPSKTSKGHTDSPDEGYEGEGFESTEI